MESQATFQKEIFGFLKINVYSFGSSTMFILLPLRTNIRCTKFCTYVEKSIRQTKHNTKSVYLNLIQV